LSFPDSVPGVILAYSADHRESIAGESHYDLDPAMRDVVDEWPICAAHEPASADDWHRFCALANETVANWTTAGTSCGFDSRRLQSGSEASAIG
jgi:hypothetical protein